MADISALEKRFEEIRDDIKKLYEELGLGKDVLLRVHDALDSALHSVRVASVRPAHDLNDDLAESVEDRPIAQAQEKAERPPIQTDDPVADAQAKRVAEANEDAKQD